MTTIRARTAAANNADLYASVFRGHAIRFMRSDTAFTAIDLPPPYYSQLTILSPDDPQATMDDIKQMEARFHGAAGLKDGFATLDLTSRGYRRLFDASWIWRAPKQVSSNWQAITTAADLNTWESAWKSAGSPTDVRMFPADMLHDDRITFLAKWQADQIVAGCIANLSNDCIGLSNVFGKNAFAAAANAVGNIAPTTPIVGYESGDDIAHATAAGFEIVGPLRIWIRPTP